ncbi:MAG: hypothetical protein IJE60_05490, partial [Tyzzerella sp.]|nr:hypothetical protein [Tyzzerella sp.]
MSTFVSNASASNQYLTNGNVLSGSNAGFEDSTEVENTSGKSWLTITDGWTTGWSDSKQVWSLEDA